MDCSPPGSSIHGDSPLQGKNTGVGFHTLLQGIFPTQGSNPVLPCGRQILYHLSHQGSPWILKWIAYAFIVLGILLAEYWSGQLFPSPGDLPNPGIEPRSPALQVFSLPAEPPGKTKNIGVGSLSLLQGIFLTQESNQGLLHCRWILYQLSYQGSPQDTSVFINSGLQNL